MGDIATMTPDLWPWLAALGVLGVYHGINPAMGWLFAVALGLQERRRSAVLRALPFIALGHEASVGVVVLWSPDSRVAGGAAAAPAGARARDASWSSPTALGGPARLVGELVLWSFLMSTAHGAGLMLFPVFLGMSMAGESGCAHHMAATESGVGTALLATGLHAAGYLAVTAFIAVLVFEKLGVGILRRAWINLDVIGQPR